MGDPSREEDGRGGPRQIFRRERKGDGVKKLADMIERHDDHDRAAQDVDGLNAELGVSPSAPQFPRQKA